MIRHNPHQHFGCVMHGEDGFCHRKLSTLLVESLSPMKEVFRVREPFNEVWRKRHVLFYDSCSWPFE